eukprot:CAMPEP_0185806448 /NCGR_PEP_ID=MMETSP1322-20130828/4442_1 /TAXON_ID=265543 /ORGANISM="Minutocellus polymorphus, Strain RCC2270" /LENGTH=39 /DNA_ID= /DNA_START= /DNA_END= /DNA_ORIENTATION=
MVFGALKKSKSAKNGEAEHAGELVGKPISNTSSKKKSGL